MPRRCVALLSGGLDSSLAIRMVQRQGIAVEALNFKTLFTCCQDEAGEAARRLGVRLTVLREEDDYLDLIQTPRFGYGKGANPCVDCRIYMFRKARQYLEASGADFVISGEVLGQRPMSQKRRDLEVIAYHADLEDRLLRPLSARLLPLTLPEREGWVNRELLGDITGQSRARLNELARAWDLPIPPSPSTGCALTEPAFGRKVHDLIRLEVAPGRWDFELLKVGRHFRFDAHCKLVVGRHEDDNVQLRRAHVAAGLNRTGLLIPENFRGPHVLVIGPWCDEVLDFAGGLIARYARDLPDPALVEVDRGGQRQTVRIGPQVRAQTAVTIAETNS